MKLTTRERRELYHHFLTHPHGVMFKYAGIDFLLDEGNVPSICVCFRACVRWLSRQLQHPVIVSYDVSHRTTKQAWALLWQVRRSD